jgi:hypothetical protein
MYKILLNVMLKIVVTSVEVRDNDNQFCVDEEDICSRKRRNHFNFEIIGFNKFKKKGKSGQKECENPKLPNLFSS